MTGNTIDAAYEVERLLAYAVRKALIDKFDVTYCRNALLELLAVEEPYAGDPPNEALDAPTEILERLLDDAAARGVVAENTLTHRDLFDTRLMGVLTPRPSEVVREFRRLASGEGVQAATDRFYALSIDSAYIRMDRIRRNLYWRAATDYGELEITVNLSKPEKDPKEIALLKNAPSVAYPKCLLCADNVGYAGRINHPARQNLRVLPLTLDDEEWFFQYSPYVYYNEHSIVFHGKHVPMTISANTFHRLLDFLEQFPHYFIGSNADLPIVGGSILNHDHFQGGRHAFPEEKAPVTRTFAHPECPDVRAGIVRWPMSVVRLVSHNRTQLQKAASAMLDAWRAYSDESVGVRAFTGETPHNTITPIARMTANGEYELDLVLRNNRTDGEHPEGIYHPHRELHHVKKENIGLIEVMGLAVLPGRLKDELSAIAELLTGASTDDAWSTDESHALHKHADWIRRLLAEHGASMPPADAERLLQDEIGRIFLTVLTHAGVYKQDESGQRAFAAFLQSIGYR
ncbi:UDP-glucose--hexose-1-phosphate uridylyltransferase [Paenibacillus sp. TRM 82003]|nr:UDP-glucose--hexose-1-phosphate uridylyltransferase [Paenibacillus sp. TRM 82003]